MRITGIILLAFVILLALAGCTSPTYEVPWDQFCFPYVSGTAQTEEVALSPQAKTYIEDLLNDGQWVDSLTNCGSDFVFYFQKQEVRYHSSCGTFNDVTSQQAVTVTEEQRIAINALLGIPD